MVISLVLERLGKGSGKLVTRRDLVRRQQARLRRAAAGEARPGRLGGAAASPGGRAAAPAATTPGSKHR